MRSLLEPSRDPESPHGRRPEDPADVDARILLPVVAGVRRGALLVDARIQPLGEDGSGNGPQRCRVELEVVREEYHMPRGTVAVLLLGLAGAIGTSLVPFVGILLPLVPVMIATMVLAWFLVLARVSYRGFDAWVELLSEQPAES